MTFGDALVLMKQGKKVRRAGWNGKGIFISIQKKPFADVDDFISINTTGLETDNPDAPKSIVPWVASQTDMLANDWERYSKFNGVLRLRVRDEELPDGRTSVWSLRVHDGRALQALLTNTINDAEWRGIVTVERPSKQGAN